MKSSPASAFRHEENLAAAPAAVDLSGPRIIEYASEMRFGVVLYGGVSLAIYMNGVTNEMYEMVCATPKQSPHTDALAGTREIYRRVAWLADNPALRAHYCRLIESRKNQRAGKPPDDVWDDAPLKFLQPMRLVVDVISGTSAGGINGIFLAKALANGECFSPLQDLWVQEGDIALLLNDKRSYHGLDIPKRHRCPASLLNSDRMYIKLFEAMESMDSEARDGDVDKPPELVDEIDLFVTTTDILGSPVPLRLSGQLVYERRHKQSFHFSYSQGLDRNDFGTRNNGLLAFAARCTSSFPFAFEPMTMKAVRDLKTSAYEAVEKDWHKYLSYLSKSEVASGNHIYRAFGDGGYLDNKPFSYVARALTTRQAYVPVERKLIYVEPRPEAVDPAQTPNANTTPPDALANSMAALTGIPRYETIREDLQELLRRNRSIERVDRIVREGEADLHNLLKGDSNPFVRILKESGGQIPPWPEFKRKEMVSFYGTAFLAYRRLRVSSTTDELAFGIARLWDIDFKSDHLYALTALLREWRMLHYQEDPEDRKQSSVNAFLDRFDVSYRIRKLSFLMRQIDNMIRILRKLHLKLPVTEHEVQPASEDARIIDGLRRKNSRLLEMDVDEAILAQSIDALHLLKTRMNDAQAKWRVIERRRREPAPDSNFIDESLRNQLRSVLSLLLGQKLDQPIKLPTILGHDMIVKLSDETLRACACCRTMQDSVQRRTKELFRAAAGPERTYLYEAIEASLDALSLPKIDPSIWDILGKPTLELERDQNGEENAGAATVRVQSVHNAVLDSANVMPLRCLLGEYYLYFDLFDQMSFPLYHDSGVGEPATVEVVRISPVDAKNLIDESRDQRRKLAGTALSNFGAFIDRRWRLNDIMWGRLDGAERLIQTLLPMSDHSTEVVRQELIERAHHMILRECLLSEGSRQVTDLMCKALAEMPGEGQTLPRIRELLTRTAPGESQHSERLASMLAACMSEQALVDYVRNMRDVDRTLDPATTLNAASRAVTISGRILEGISRRRERGELAFRWLARTGLMFQGLVAVSLPGNWKGNWGRRILNTATLVAIVLLIFAMLFPSLEKPGFAVAVLAALIAVRLMFYAIRDFLLSRQIVMRTAWVLIILAVAASSILGIFTAHERWPAWRTEMYTGACQAEAKMPLHMKWLNLCGPK